MPSFIGRAIENIIENPEVLIPTIIAAVVTSGTSLAASGAALTAEQIVAAELTGVTGLTGGGLSAAVAADVASGLTAGAAVTSVIPGATAAETSAATIADTGAYPPGALSKISASEGLPLASGVATETVSMAGEMAGTGSTGSSLLSTITQAAKSSLVNMGLSLILGGIGGALTSRPSSIGTGPFGGSGRNITVRQA